MAAHVPYLVYPNVSLSTYLIFVQHLSNTNLYLVLTMHIILQLDKSHVAQFPCYWQSNGHYSNDHSVKLWNLLCDTENLTIIIKGHSVKLCHMLSVTLVIQWLYIVVDFGYYENVAAHKNLECFIFYFYSHPHKMMIQWNFLLVWCSLKLDPITLTCKLFI